MCVTGTMAAEKGHKWIEDLLSDYNGKNFILPDGSFDKTPNTQMITELTINKYGWKTKNEHQVLEEGLNIYPFEVFCAKDWKTGKIKYSSCTYTIHHFQDHGKVVRSKFKNKIQNIIGPKGTQFIINVKKKIKGHSMKK